MNTLSLYLRNTIFLLLIWMYQCFYNFDSNKTLVDKNILQTKNKLKYERVLAEGDISGKKQTYAKECIEESPLGNKKNKCKNPVRYENPYDHWNKVVTPKLREQFDKETSEMDPNWRDQKWNNEWNKISADKVNDLSSIYHRQDISEEEKKELIFPVVHKLFSEFQQFIDECKKEMIGNKTESESKKEMIDNKTESESNNEMTDNKTESESKDEVTDNKTESESKKETIGNKTESESKKEMIDNKTASESKKEMIDNKTESESKNEIIDNKTASESKKEMTDNETASESKNEKRKKKINFKKFDLMKHLIFHKIEKIYDDKK
ncbi:fam-g protein [Plasmodium gallinaceum]|uniref:Fam-g protein n=1 Tax=Plasmodium gallinaceum TaxID=5849 RepID=A0A1J1GSL1_PLAGA|nr:fam-g protein [Plasmodium gallinaceum]CRG95474.1 fam-g protein [Plasmodium gallinaceum]